MSIDSVRFDVLGPLEAWRGDSRVSLGPQQQRVVLAVLLLRANRPTNRDQIIEAVWGQTAPTYAVNLVHKHVSGLRRALEPASSGRQPSKLLTWSDGHYLLTVPAGCLDLSVFEAEVKRARVARSGGDLRAASEALHAATRLWRGSVCDGLTSPFLDAERSRLTDRWISAMEERMEADLALGNHHDLAAEVGVLVAAHPLRERLRVLLMLALYRSGRRAEALAAFQDARRHLIDELGVEPAAELEKLHQLILTADPALSVPTTPDSDTSAIPTTPGGTGPDFSGGDAEVGVDPGSTIVAQPAFRRDTARGVAEPLAGEPTGPARPVPAQLPADVYGFTGRARELSDLDGLLSGPGPVGSPDGRSTAAVISALCGTAGVGKTALAVHWAHRVRAGFPDGQLYVNLRGYDVDRPVSVGEALIRFLDALGVTGSDVPLDVDERAARFRTEVADRRMLVVLDNAASVDQVRLLLPGTPSCRVVVTSRDSLAGLVVLHGVRRINVDPLSRHDATVLLRILIGARADADPTTVATLAEQCARLPLALRLAAELAVARPSSSLAVLVAELADRHRRLHLLDAGDDVRTAVRVVFSWSYQQLPPAAARAFRTLGLHPGPDLDAYAVAALVGTDLDQARHLLDRLVRAHLVQPDHTTGRYALHDLLHAYAAECAAADDTQSDRSAAVRRMLDYYTWVTAAAARTLFPVESVPLPAAQRPATPTPPVADRAAAWAWLDAEHVTLLAACVHAADHGWPQHAVALSRALHRYLHGGHYTHALAIHTQALAAARRAGDGPGQAHTLLNLGAILRNLGKYDLATQHQVQALDLHRRNADRPGEARTLSNLGIVAHRLGDPERAVHNLHAALTLYRDLDDRYGEASVLTNLGAVQTRPDHYPEAVRHLSRAVELFGSIGGTVGQASALSYLGDTYRQLGRYTDAAKHIRAALALFRDSSHRYGQAGALTNLGLVHSRLAQHEQAIDCLNDALTLFRDIGHPHGQAHTHNGLGEALLAAGQPTQARTHHNAAFTIATETNDRNEQTRAQTGLNKTHNTTTHTRP